MNDKTQTVYIVDDDEAVRDSISLLLDTMNIEHQTFPSATVFLEQLTPATLGVLVLDIRMPGMSGLELQRELIAINANLPVIFITGHRDIPMAVEAMKHGAVDFIRKPFRQQELLDRINEAMDLEATTRTKRQDLDALVSRRGTLTPREAEVFNRVAIGQANKVIAFDLEISERTVEIHRSQVMKKMQVRTLADLVRMRISLERGC